uniref:p59 n=1 Tax=Tomato chlorosis virus TaxID=67754 RepID=R9VYX5_9CLOS|nr:p59 [Tomato chlorosis virus]
MEPVDTSERVKRLFSVVFKKSNNDEKIHKLADYLLKYYSTENRNLYRTTVNNKAFSFTSTYSVSGGKVYLDTKEPWQVVKLIIIYLYKVEPGYLKKTNYSPENLFARLRFDDYYDEWNKYFDKDVNDYLADHPEEGCLYTMNDIMKEYPGEEPTAQLTLYRVCNSLGKKISVRELKEGKISAFKIESKTDNAEIGEGVGGNALFKECVETLQSYLLLNSSKAGREKIRANAKIFECYLSSLVPKGLDKKLAANPLVVAKFVNAFTIRTVNSKGFGDNFKAVKELSPELLSFIKRVFLVDARLNEDVLFIALPKNSVVEILGDKFAVGEYLKVQNVLPASSNSSSLPPDIDKCVSDALVTFMRTFGNFQPAFILDIWLFVFGKMTTNSKLWREDNEILVTVGDVVVKSTTSRLLSHVKNCVRRDFPQFSTDNIIRQWANLRGDRAKQMFQLMNFRPGLFSSIPGIKPYMRFDFFKMLDLSKCTREEIESYQTLRRVTESRSNKTACDDRCLESWILRK